MRIRIGAPRPQSNGRTKHPGGLAAAGAALLLIMTAPALAEHTRFWRQSEYAEFSKGTPHGVALRSDGRLVPAPRFAQFADPNMAYLWALRLDSHNHLYAAGGSNAKVVRLDQNGAPTTVFESQELAAQAIALDATDNLYVGTSPDGKVYKVTPSGEKTVFFDPKEKYIWALAVDSGGVLFVATGDTGQVFAVAANGQGKLFYKSEERHARTLAFDTQGNLLIGTDPSGLVLRVEISRKTSIPTAGRAFVLYETDKKEVTALQSADDGSIYAAAIGEKPRPVPLPGAGQGITTVPPSGAAPNVSGGQQIITSTQAPISPAPIAFFPNLTGGGEVYRIASDGSPKSLWSSRDDLAYSLGSSHDGKLLLGVGNHGGVVELDGDGAFSNIADTSSEQVTSLLPGPGGLVYVATANPGKIFVAGPGYESRGWYESDAFDAHIFSQWGKLSWWGENAAPPGRVAFYVRSGNTSNPSENWSDWYGPYSNPQGDTVNCPPARFVQWKVVFVETDGHAAPEISWVSLAYLPKNIAPVIDEIIAQDPGIRIADVAIPSATASSTQPVMLRMPQPRIPGVQGMSVFSAESAPRPAKMDIPPQGFAQKGYISVVWSAHDDNDDDLVYSLYIRGEGEKNWRLLKDNLEQRYYSWDSTSLPDGAYYLKVVASDSRANPSDRALSTERVSDRFEVDNTPPTIEHLRADVSTSSRATASISFDAHDSASAISETQFSLDAGAWEVLFPKGLLSDSTQQSYSLVLHDLAPGEHTFSVRLKDRFDNTASSKITFTIPR